MSRKVINIAFLALLCPLVISSPVKRQQSTASDISYYVANVKTALYAVGNIQAGNASIACSDPSCIDDLNNEGYNGTLAGYLL